MLPYGEIKTTLRVMLEELENYYKEEKFSDGVTWLEKNRESFSCKDYYTHLGAFQYKSKKYLEAKKSFSHAYICGAQNHQILNNTTLSNRMLGIAPPWSSSEKVLLHTLYFPTAYYSLAFLFLAALFLFFARKVVKKLSKIIVVAIFVAMFGGIFLVKKRFQLVVVNEEAIVREGGAEVYAETLRVPAGAQILINKAKKELHYYPIVFPRKWVGWISQEDLDFLTDGPDKN